MSANWHYSKGDCRFGPVSSQRLKELATNGDLSPNDLVWKDGMSDWKPAKRIKGLFPESQGNTAAPPPLPSAKPITPSVPLPRDIESENPGTSRQPDIFDKARLFSQKTREALAQAQARAEAYQKTLQEKSAKRLGETDQQREIDSTEQSENPSSFSESHEPEVETPRFGDPRPRAKHSPPGNKGKPARSAQTIDPKPFLVLYCADALATATLMMIVPDHPDHLGSSNNDKGNVFGAIIILLMFLALGVAATPLLVGALMKKQSKIMSVFGKELYFYEPKSLVGWIAYFFMAPMIMFLAVVAIATFLGLAAKQKQCRSCRTTIAREVSVCPFCGSRT